MTAGSVAVGSSADAGSATTAGPSRSPAAASSAMPARSDVGVFVPSYLSPLALWPLGVKLG
ncbi:hypothetical protein [Pseudarthrobacter raffinosi]|uniref:hypothetical protein n=1 Tax=Pseudarthrobacter raffinosi TaxID=2953651 RepID=UPI00208F10B3|nr:hypothetical protein [Pseudarthrobacter sp. MDT3-9]MCO4250680.1 hypothetical protein [Pseudarthrobacter sp. MDT3-9]